jgi:AcrR family transcriptional regulator
MSGSKKSPRPYDSSRRQQQARQTRRLVLEAARALFIDRGYAGATIEAIAQQAGVAPETVYAAFGSKRKLLARLIEFSVGGDDQGMPLMQRPGPSAVLQEADPTRQIELFASDITAILLRVAPLFPILRTAAKTEHEIDGLLQTLLEGRRKNLSIFIHSLETHSPLRAGLDSEQATDLAWALSSPDVFNLLTVDRGWSADRFGAWLADSLIRLLLP